MIRLKAWMVRRIKRLATRMMVKRRELRIQMKNLKARSIKRIF